MMSQNNLEALRMVLKYLYQDEENEWEASFDEDVNDFKTQQELLEHLIKYDKDHIFTAIVKLKLAYFPNEDFKRK